MGNTPLTCVNGGGEVKKARVLLPDGNIVLLDEPVEAAELMIEHINHMVVHCSSSGSKALGTHTTMKIMQPHEMLQPGQAYVVHPIPSQSNKKTKLRPQAILSAPKRNGSQAAAKPAREKNGEGGDKNQEQANPHKQSKTRFLQRYQTRVADSSQSENASQASVLKPETPGTLRSLNGDDARSARDQKDSKEYTMEEIQDDDDTDILLNLNMYMGWRPALESIPESPVGHHPPTDMIPQPPLLCV